MNELPKLESLAIEGQSVLVRVDFNVPIEKESVVDDARIRSALPTIEYLLSKDCKVILCSHLGRPNGTQDSQFTLLPVASKLSSLLRKDIIFPDDCVGPAVEKLVDDMEDGQVMLLENLRFHAEEKANDENFAQQLASLADFYVNDAFGVCHRAHASVYAVPELFEDNRAAGYLLQREVEVLSKLLDASRSPFYAILGGAKVSDKINLIMNLMKRVDGIFIGGAMANTFLAAQGLNVGASLVEEEKLQVASQVIERSQEKGVPIYLPNDHIVCDQLPEPTQIREALTTDIKSNEMIVDIGPQTRKEFANLLASARTIFWNGPMGVFEVSPFERGTLSIAQALSKVEAVKVVGGGDSIRAISQLKLEDAFTHLSTGGGASLSFLEGRELPGLKILTN